MTQLRRGCVLTGTGSGSTTLERPRCCADCLPSLVITAGIHRSAAGILVVYREACGPWAFEQRVGMVKPQLGRTMV